MADNTNLVAKAWNDTKADADPEFDLIPNSEFRENLNYRASKVKETGIANTNFEKMYASLLANEPKDPAPMAVVDDGVNINYAASAEGIVAGEPNGTTPANVVEEEAPAEKEAIEPKKAKTAKKAKVVKKGATQIAEDTSGHVPTGEEAASIIREERNSPIHP